MYEEQTAWLGQMVNAWRWSRNGRSLADFEPNPTAAVLEAVLLLETEVEAMQAEKFRIEEKKRAGQGAMQ